VLTLYLFATPFQLREYIDDTEDYINIQVMLPCIDAYCILCFDHSVSKYILFFLLFPCSSITTVIS
jgi:hypothetical protein